METMECILTRRSIRSFIPDKEIAEETMRQLMEAVRWAPSWANTQTWEVVVVKDRDLKQKLVDAAGANRAAQAILDACAVMVFCSRRGIAGAGGYIQPIRETGIPDAPWPLRISAWRRTAWVWGRFISAVLNTGRSILYWACPRV